MTIVFTAALSFICGIAVSTMLPNYQGSVLCSIGMFALLTLLLRRRRFSRLQIKLYVMTFAFCVGLLPISVTETVYNNFKDNYDSECIMYGRITGLENTDPENVRATVKLYRLKNEDHENSSRSQIYVYADRGKFEGAQIGDEVIMRGSIIQPESAMNPGDFNLRRYYFSINISGMVYDPASVDIYEGSFYPPLILHKIQNFSSDAIYKLIDGDNAEFVRAVLLGDRSGFSDTLTENIRRVGISHVTAVSGMHVSILISLILMLTNPFTKRRRTKAKIVIAVLLFYMALSGFSPSVIRASVMGACCMVGVLAGRRANSVLLLLICASGMLLINPFLLYNPSFMLSFLSSAALSVFIPAIKARFKRSSMLGDTLLMTVIANLATLPYVMWNFDYYSWIGLLSNMLIVPLISAVFIGGFITVVLSYVPFVGAVAGTFTGGICSLILSLTNTISDFALGRVTVRMNNVFYLAAFYLVIVLVYLILRRKTRPLAVVSCLIIASMLTGAAVNIVNRLPFTVTHLYVGQGDSTVVQIPGGDIYLIDTGDVNTAGNSRCLDYLNNAGIRRIKGIILSHEDADHSGALENIISEIPTEKIYISGNSAAHRDVSKITNAAKKHGCEIVTVNSGNVLEADEVTFNFLYPYRDLPGLDSNDGSLVTELRYKGRSFLFTGDITKKTEPFVSALINNCDVLKVAHHGSDSSTSQEFMDASDPEYAVISAGSLNRYSHPNSAVTDLLAEYRTRTFITFKHGAVRFKVSEKGTLTYTTTIDIS